MNMFLINNLYQLIGKLIADRTNFQYFEKLRLKKLLQNFKLKKYSWIIHHQLGNTV